MNSLILYVNESAISIAILYSVYWFFFRKDTFFILNRVYLLGSVIFSILLPALSLNLPFSVEEGNYAYVLQTITISKESLVNATSNHLDMMQIIFIIWVTGVSIFMLRFVFQMVQLFRLMKRYGITRHEGLAIVLMENGYAPFSFFSITFLNKELTKEEFTQIFAHEKIHAKQMHSADILLLELLTIIQWFNPFVWFIRNSIKAIHEYLADEGVLREGHQKVDYQQVLLSMTLGVRVNDLSNNFNYSLIKRRFIMMTKNRSGNMARLKLLFIFPVVAALFIVFSCNRTSEGQVNKDNQDVKLTNQAPTDAKNENIQLKEEEMPQFQGGNEALTAFIIENVKYPDKARKAGIQGKVFITFTIDKDGKVKNAKVQKSVDPALDAEALRVINKMPAWTNVKKADIEMTLPINFKLA